MKTSRAQSCGRDIRLTDAMIERLKDTSIRGEGEMNLASRSWKGTLSEMS
jgi:hypothetical protein